MPDKDGKLTDEERQKVVAWVTKYPATPDARCPICGSPNWMVAEHLVQPITIGPGMGLQLGGLGYPQVQLISDPCGYTRLLNAVMIGLLPPGEKPKDSASG
jgi:hypothetical protein